jgi:WD40 repeat protein
VWNLAAALDRAGECSTCSPPRQPTVELQRSDPQTFIHKVRFARDGKLAATGGHIMRPMPPALPPPPADAGAGNANRPPPPQPGYDAVITLNDPATGRVVDTITIPDSPRPEFDLSRDARFVVVGRPDGVAIVWDRKARKQTAECRGHQGAIRGVTFHPTLASFATAGQDGTVRLWSVEGKETGVLKHPGPVTCVLFNPAGDLLAAGDASQTVFLWNVASREQIRMLPGHYGELSGLSFNGTGQFLAGTSRRPLNDGWEGDLKVWEVATGKQTLSIPAHTWWEADVAFHPSQPQIAITGKEHTLQMYHAETGQLLMTLPTYGHLCNSLTFSPDGRRLLAMLMGSAKLIDPTPEPLAFGNAPPPTARPSPAPEAAAR